MKKIALLLCVSLYASIVSASEKKDSHLLLSDNEVLLYNSQGWILTRDVFNNSIRLNYLNPSFNNLLPASISKDNVLQDIQVDKKGNLYLILYDAVNNTPSGRALAGITNHSRVVYVDVYSKSVSVLSESLELGGVDTAVSSSFWGNGIAICSASSCYSIDKENGVIDWSQSRWSNFYLFNNLSNSVTEFVEVNFNENEKIVSAILRKKYDSRFDGALTKEYADFYLVVFDNRELFYFEKITNDVPWGITFSNLAVNYKLVSQTSDVMEVFYYDLDRLTKDGMLLLAVNNMEGRVTWAQLYYLNGINNVLRLSSGNDVGLRKRKLQLDDEIGYLSMICNTEYPGMKVKRYSMEREPIDIALHLGLINDLLYKYLPHSSSEKNSKLAQSCIEKNFEMINGFVGTLEGEKKKHFNGGSISYPYYKYGYPFWADGANLPYNYVSGISLGLLNYPKYNEYSKVTDYLAPLQGEVKKITDASLAWNYWWAEGNEGWNESQKISFNTPRYVGNQNGLAHITYLTMDAKALLTLNKKVPIDLAVINIIKRMTRKGLILPSINETHDDLWEIDMEPRSRYSRATTIWELQSQPYVLKQFEK